MTLKVIGHGTWYDKTAAEIVTRERKLGRDLELVRTEMGLGASGLPHVGSFGDAARSFAITLALRERGFNSELIAFSDDKDGLRKVPAGFPREMEKWLGHPVTDIPDPFKCHGSFGEHMSFLLLEALDKAGVEYRFISAKKSYEEGLFNEEIKAILLNATSVGKIVREVVGQQKFTKALPYFPICENCGRIYTTTGKEYLPKEGKVIYRCDGMEIKGRWLEGCGFEGEAQYEKGEGKLSWKGEFAVRWKALDIRFEAYGKDIEDSVKINKRICREILNHEPPFLARYEMFLDKSGRKISKSAGNVFTPQVWFRYGSPQSLNLLMLKRFAGTRELSHEDIPRYMNEFDELEDVYFGKKQIQNEKERAKLVGLYEYCSWLQPPSKPSTHLPYNLLVSLVQVAPKGGEQEYVMQKLRDYNYVRQEQTPQKDIEERVKYAQNWSLDFNLMPSPKIPRKLEANVREALIALAQTLRYENDAETVQSAIFDIARKNNVPPRQLFQIIYLVLLGAPEGPRLGSYIFDIGKQKVIDALEQIRKQ